MYIEPHIVDQILAAATTDIVGLIQSYGVKLKKKGSRYIGKNPFREDKNPSFTVDPSRGTFVDWAQPEYRGNTFKFVMLMEHCEWLEAVYKLAERYGIDTATQLTEAQRATHDLKKRALAAMDAAVAYYHHQLTSTAAGQQLANDYLLQERGYDPGDIARFSLGLSPAGWEGLLTALRAHGYTDQELKAAGLVGYSDKSQKFYDRFRGRWMIPIFDHLGKPVAFGARKLPGAPDEEPKYINSSETVIYSKSAVLYGFHWAVREVEKHDAVILLEGYTDVMSLHMRGITHAVASCGTALTIEQARLIKRHASQVIIIRDSDEAGQKATARDIELLLGEGLLPSVVTLPVGEDPDTFIQKEHSHGFLAYIDEHQQEWLEWSISTLSRTYDISQPAGKQRITDDIVQLIRRIAHPVLREEYAERMGTALSLSADTVAQLMGEAEVAMPRRMNWEQFTLFARSVNLPVPAGWGRAEDGGVEIPYFTLAGNRIQVNAGGEKRPASRVTTMGETYWGVYIPQAMIKSPEDLEEFTRTSNGYLILTQDEITAEMLAENGIAAVGLSNPEAFRASQTGTRVCKQLRDITEAFPKLVYLLPGEAWSLPPVQQHTGAPYKDSDAGAMARTYAEALTKFVQAFPKNRTFVAYADHRQTEIPSRETRWVELAIIHSWQSFHNGLTDALFGEEDRPVIAHEISTWTPKHIEDMLKIHSGQAFLDFHGARALGSPFKLDRITYKIDLTSGKAEYLEEETPEPDVKIQRGRIWGRQRDGGWKDITNFAMECQLRIMGKGAFGIYKIQNVSTGQLRTVIIRNSEFRKAENFAERVSEIPRLGAFSKASTYQLAELQQLVCEGAPEATNLDRVMGFYSPSDEIDRHESDQHFWVFGNGILNGQWKSCDPQGLVTIDGETFYLPAYSNIKEDPEKHEKKYERQMGFTFEPGKLTWEDWTRRVHSVYGNHALTLTAFCTMAMYYDMILTRQGDAPLLHLVGPPGTGKNQLIESFSRIWAKSMKWMDLQTAKITPAAYASFFEQYSNALNIVNEYNPSSVSDDRLDPIKATYEGKLGEKKTGPNTNEMYSGRVTSAVVVMGQEELYTKKAITHRCVVLELTERSYTQAERTAFNELKELEKLGLGNIFVKLATHRALINEHFDRKFRLIQEQIDQRIPHKTGNTERLIRNWANMLAPLMILIDNGIITFVMQPAEILDYAAQQIEHHDIKMTQQGLLQLFFEDFVSAYYMEPRYQLHHNHVFHLEVTEYTIKGEAITTPDGVITVQTNNIFPLFQQYIKDRGLKVENSSKSDLRREMKQHPAFLCAADNEQVGFKMDENRRVKFKMAGEGESLPIPHRTSAYVFDARRLGIDLRRSWSFQDMEAQPEEKLPF